MYSASNQGECPFLAGAGHGLVVLQQVSRRTRLPQDLRLRGRAGCCVVSATVPSRLPRPGSDFSVPALHQSSALVKESHVRRPPDSYF